jgi:hypothetical protein
MHVRPFVEEIALSEQVHMHGSQARSVCHRETDLMLLRLTCILHEDPARTSTNNLYYKLHATLQRVACLHAGPRTVHTPGWQSAALPAYRYRRCDQLPWAVLLDAT